VTDPTQRTPADCAQAQLDAYNARDIASFAAVYHEEIQLFDLSSGNAFCTSRTQLIERYGTMFADHPELHCALIDRIVCPPFVIDEERVTGLAPGREVHAVATYEVRDGLIVKAWFIREEVA
jgi:putative hydrolase of HD superfamily